MKKVFIASYGASHANIMKALYPVLKQEFDTEILALTLADSIFNHANIPHYTIKDYLYLFDNTEQSNILDLGQKLAKVEYNPNCSMQLEDCVVYLGMGMLDLIKSLGSYEKASVEFHKNGRKAFCPVSIAKRILSYVKPNIVLLSVNVRFEAALGIAANKLDIPVLYIQESPYYSEISFYTDICVMNEYTANLFRQSPCKKIGNIFVTGQPVFNRVDNISQESIIAVRNTLKMTKYKKVVVFLEDPISKETSSIEDTLIKESLNNKSTLYIFKLHPNMDITKEIEQIHDNCVRVRDVDLYALLATANVAITRKSISGLEAAFIGVDLIVADVLAEEEEVPLVPDYSELGIALKATTIEELTEYLNALLDNNGNDYDLKTSRQSFKNIPNAAQNICNVIKELILDY